MNLQDELKNIAPKATITNHDVELYFSVVFHCPVHNKTFILCQDEGEPHFVDMATGVTIKDEQLKNAGIMAVKDIDFAVKIRKSVIQQMINQRKEAEIDGSEEELKLMDAALEEGVQVAHLAWVDAKEMKKMQEDPEYLKKWSNDINERLIDFLGDKRKLCHTLYVIDKVFGEPDY